MEKLRRCTELSKDERKILDNYITPLLSGEIVTYELNFKVYTMELYHLPLDRNTFILIKEVQH